MYSAAIVDRYLAPVAISKKGNGSSKIPRRAHRASTLNVLKRKRPPPKSNIGFAAAAENLAGNVSHSPEVLAVQSSRSSSMVCYCIRCEEYM